LTSGHFFDWRASRSRRPITTLFTRERGEAAIRGNTTYGTGIYKSIDAGNTWKNVDLKTRGTDRAR